MKKIIALILMISLVLSATVAVYADDTNITENNSYSREFEVLSALGFADGLEEHYQDFSETMTRADFIGLCARLTGRVGENYDSVFNDVASGSYMEREINAALNAGLISKADNFMPDAPITYEQVCRVLVSLLGYDLVVEIESGNQSGYVKKASELGLAKRIIGKSEITKREGVEAIYKALSVDVLQFKGTSYKVVKGQTVLSVNFDIFEDEGIVRANSETSLQVKDSSVGENRVKIDDDIYNCGDTNAEDLLGLKCKFFYHYDEESDVATLKHISKIEDENEVINVLAADIVSCSEGVFRYSDANGRAKKKTISRSADVLYNGKAYPDYTDADLMPACGEVILIDNDNDGDIDVIFVYSQENYFASIISMSDYIITDKVNNKTLKLPLDDDTVRIRIIKNKADIDFSAIEKNNVVTVFESKDSDLYIIYVSDSAVTGEITSSSGTYDSDAGSWDVEQPCLTVNGREYNVSLNCRDDLRIGTDATVYLNVYNEVVHVEYEHEYTFAYLLKATMSDAEADPVFTLRMVSQDDAVVVYKLAKYVRINDTRYCTIKNNFSLTTEGIWDNSLGLTDNRKVIAYSLNADDEISVLFTPVAGEPKENKLTRTVTSEKTSSYKGGSVNAFFKSYTDAQTGQKLYETHFLDDNPIIFNVPTDSDDETRIRVIPLKRIRSDHAYAVDGYAFGKTGMTKVILKRVASSKISGDFTINYMLITGVAKVWEDDEIHVQLNGLVAGTPTSITLDSDVSNLDGLSKGSFIMYNKPITDGDRIANIEVLFNKGNNKVAYPPSATGYGYNSYYRTHYAKITDIEDGFVMLKDDNNGVTYKYRTGGATIYTADADSKKGNFSKADISDVRIGSHVFMSIRSEKLDVLVIYK